MNSPVSSDQRTLTGKDFFLLWMGAGIALTEIWAGGLLAGMGFWAGFLAILIGHVIGNTPMALAGIIGSRHGVPSMVSTRSAMGMRGSYLPAILNIIQLVGWTAVMLWIGGQTAAALMKDALPLNATIWILITGALTILWTLGGHPIWKKLQTMAIGLLFILSVVMTFIVFRQYGFQAIIDAKPSATPMGFGKGLDLVLAMPVSWIPLAADYARFAKTTRTSFWGTWTGYFVASSWMYTVGLAVAIATGSTTPDAMVMEVMAASGWLIGALVIVLISTFTTTFLDIYSNAVSAKSLCPALGERPLVIITGLLGTALALLFEPLQFEPFLLMIGSVFCPLFGIVFADYFVLSKGHYNGDELFDGKAVWYKAGFNIAGLTAWVIGTAVFHLCSKLGFSPGGSIPSMLAAGLLYLVLTRGRKVAS